MQAIKPELLNPQDPNTSPPQPIRPNRKLGSGKSPRSWTCEVKEFYFIICIYSPVIGDTRLYKYVTNIL